MGTIISGSSIVQGNGEKDSTIQICGQAVMDVIEKTGIDKKTIDLLINIGMNRDQNIVEPAIAALIQKEARLNINPTRKRLTDRNATFAFDLIHGANGFIYAAEVVDSFFKSGQLKNAIIVSSEIHPSGRKVNDFPFKPFGAAILLQYSENNEVGFQSFKYKIAKEGSRGLSAYCDTLAHGSNARNIITIEFEENFAEQLEKFTIDELNRLIKAKELDISQIKHLIASTPSKVFGRHVSDALGFNTNTLVDVFPEYGDIYTSAPLIGYHEAITQGLIKKNEQILFVCGGSGPSCSFGIYQT